VIALAAFVVVVAGALFALAAFSPFFAFMGKLIATLALFAIVIAALAWARPHPIWWLALGVFVLWQFCQHNPGTPKGK